MIPRKNLGRVLQKALSQPGYAFQAFFKRLGPYLCYHFFDGRSAYPETISIFLTYQCNLRCKMCGQWGETGASKFYTPEILNQQLEFADVRKLVDEVQIFSPTITLFGGEPLLYKEWVRVVEHIKNKGLRCNMITNGTLLESHAERVVEVGLDEIILSLDGPKEIHDEVRGRKGTFTKLCSGVQKINQLKALKHVKRPIININSTIFDFNYRYMEDVIDVAVQLEARTITFHHFIFISRQICEKHNKFFKEMFGTISHDWAGFVDEKLPNMDTKHLIESIHRIKQSRYPVAVSFYPNFTDEEIKRYYTNFEFIPDSYADRCISPWMVAYIFPDGTIRPCLSLNYLVGNIKEHCFREIWNSSRYERFRKIVKRNKSFLVCTKCTEFYRF